MQISAYFGIATLTFAVIYFLAKKSQRKRGRRPAKPGTVVLHQFPRDCFRVLSGSPPCLKLETFLRMAKLPYENDFSFHPFSKKGKMPWIECNGQEIADSNFSVWFLEKEFQVDVDSHLSPTERAISHIIRTMLEENTYWTLMHTRMVSDYGAASRERIVASMLARCGLLMGHLLFYGIRKGNKKNLWSHGIGRHTEQELYGIAERDLLAVSKILGEKKFLFGEEPCSADAALFAFIVGCAWDMPESPIAQLTKSKAKNLEKHAQRMKEMYYPDCDEIMSEKPKFE